MPVCFDLGLMVTYREWTIHLAADTIRFDSMQKNICRYNTDTIRLLNCLHC